MRFRVRYGDPAALVADHDQQFAKGGLLVRVEPPDGLELFAPVELELVCELGTVQIEGQIVQMVPGVGVAVGFSPADELAALVERARAAGGGDGGAATHEIVDEAEDQRSQRASAAGASTKVDMIHMARYGKRDERMQIMRGGNRALHRHVLKNPKLGLDEVASIAKMTTVSPELLKAIAERREWAQRPEIALALVRNPKTPVPVAIKMLAHVSAADLRQIAKSTAVRMPILKAARKRVLR